MIPKNVTCKIQQSQWIYIWMDTNPSFGRAVFPGLAGNCIENKQNEEGKIKSSQSPPVAELSIIDNIDPCRTEQGS